VINVNLIGSFNMLRLAAAAIAETEANADGERGVIINTASVAVTGRSARRRMRRPKRDRQPDLARRP
jgi:NAD(P)-dependent dehydrogenase (short-subunit alcohol dehydrogenase family)